MTKRIRTTHTGSLPRPAELISLLSAHEQGEPVDQAAMELAISDAVEAALARQREVGIDIVNDGEMSKISYASYVYHRLSGISRSSEPWSAPTDGPLADDFRRYPGWGAEMAANMESRSLYSLTCDGPLGVKDMEPLHADISRLRTAADAAGASAVFMNAASPGIVGYFISNRHYPTRSAYLAALVDALRPEYEAIVAAGFILQLDCPDLSLRHIAGLSDSELEVAKIEAVEAINAATASIDPQRMRMHLCWGNYQGPHDCDLPLSAVLPFACRARPAAISFEAANPRHGHEWTYFDAHSFPEDKIAIPGVIDSTTSFIEHPELVAQRIARFVERLGAERVIAGVDCGFASHALAPFDADIAFAKLKSLVDGAAMLGGSGE
jgi:5-methyltetrahydropteroyltriglutamate--homocysteine methyltransferase